MMQQLKVNLTRAIVSPKTFRDIMANENVKICSVMQMEAREYLAEVS